MPPEPIGARISYGPTRVPPGKDINRMTDCTLTAAHARRVSELAFGLVGRQLQKFLGRQSAASKARFTNRTLEVIHLVDADSHRRMSRPFRLKVDCCLALQFA